MDTLVRLLAFGAPKFSRHTSQLDQLPTFRRQLLAWFESQKRDLPWRRTNDPYAIWLSEVMLQQTRVTAVIPYYLRFLERFPTVEALAIAPEPDLLAHWAGLGYYYRARNLQKAAREIVTSGSFPTTYDRIRTLPGVGEYTAAAVASIAFNLPFAVLDGNVFRVLSRLYADPTNIASGEGKKHFACLAHQVLDRESPGAFNQAMMELGATVCLPKNPLCLICPVHSHCLANKRNNANELPLKVKDKRNVRKDRVLFWIERDGMLLAWQRPVDSRLMPGFWELPEVEHLPEVVPGAFVGSFKHGITIYDYRFQIAVADAPSDIAKCVWKPISSLLETPISTIFRKAVRILENRTPAANVKAATSG